jgi:general secretion pathway protein C
MKRWPILVSFVLFVGLCASATFWAMQFFKPTVRQVAMPKPQARSAVDPTAAIGLFGGRAVEVAAASNFQLKGVVVANNADESVAILAADSKPPEAIRINTDIIPGVTVKEVHAQYVLLSDGGVVKRVDLPINAPTSSAPSTFAPSVPPVAQPIADQPPVQQAEAPPQPPPNQPNFRRGGRRRRNNNEGPNLNN